MQCVYVYIGPMEFLVPKSGFFWKVCSKLELTRPSRTTAGASNTHKNLEVRTPNNQSATTLTNQQKHFDPKIGKIPFHFSQYNFHFVRNFPHDIEIKIETSVQWEWSAFLLNLCHRFVIETNVGSFKDRCLPDNLIFFVNSIQLYSSLQEQLCLPTFAGSFWFEYC